MPKNILVVDDDRLMVELNRRKLEERGYVVHTASNGQEALERLKVKIPDMILLDVNMPDMNGYTFIIEKDKTPEYVNIPVVMLTASDETRRLFERHRVKGYLLKPFKLQDLFDKVLEVAGPPE
jgi:CheY-like chemotaxis protein